MKSKVVAIALSFAVVSSAQAQRQVDPQRQQAAQKLLKSFNSSAAIAAQRIELLEQVDSAGLPPNAGNVSDVRRLLSSKVSSEEKVALVRILAGMHTYDDQAGQNSVIAADMRRMAQLGDKSVARAATLSYSRMGYHADLADVLAQARTKGVVTIDEYFGELAHGLPYAPAHAQGELAALLAKGDNDYAAKILAESACHPEIDAMLYPEVRNSILALLIRREPAMSPALGEFGYVDAIFYVTWLKAVATLTEATGGRPYAEVVMAHLKDSKTDPRKLIAFLESEDGKRLMATIGKKQLASAVARAIAYARAFPDHPLMKPMADEIAKTADAVKG